LEQHIRPGQNQSSTKSADVINQLRLKPMLGANARLKPTLGAVSHCLKEAWNYNFDHFV